MPTFGYSEYVDDDNILLINQIAGSPATPESEGTAQSITACMLGWSAGEEVKCALYDSDRNLVAETEELTTGGNGWKTFNFDSPPSITISEYTIVAFGDDMTSIEMDTSAGSEHYLRLETSTYPTFEDPISSWDTNASNVRVSIYCTYTESGGGGTTLGFQGDGRLNFSGGSKELQFMTV